MSSLLPALKLPPCTQTIVGDRIGLFLVGRIINIEQGIAIARVVAFFQSCGDAEWGMPVGRLTKGKQNGGRGRRLNSDDCRG